MAKKVSKAEFKHTMSKRMVDVSQTKFDSKTKRVTNAKGKLYTGSVDMGGGKTQTYEKGRRIKASSELKGFRSPKTSNGSARTSSNGKVKETTKLPATRTNTVSSGYTSGSYTMPSSGTGPAPASISKPAMSGTSSPRAKSAEMRKRQAVKTRDTRAQSNRARTRQTAVKKAALTAINPLGTSTESFLKLSGNIGRTIRTSTKNWWEGK